MTDILPILTAALIVALFLLCLEWYNRRHPRKVIGPVRDPDDHSRIPLFHPGELVKDKPPVVSTGVGEVLKNEGPRNCWVVFGDRFPDALPCDEHDLRHLTRWEFFLHKLPKGQWMMGNNSYPFVLIGACIVLIGCSVYSVAVDTGWWALPLHVVTIGYPVILWRQTMENYKGKQG
jgi:hypothetical protein